jgi:hypothetical protein
VSEDGVSELDIECLQMDALATIAIGGDLAHYVGRSSLPRDWIKAPGASHLHSRQP